MTPLCGLGEVIQGPRPKKHKQILIEEKEYAFLMKIQEKVSRLEKLVADQFQFRGLNSEVFSGLADPVFAFKAAAKEPKCIMIRDVCEHLTEKKSTEKVEYSKADKGKRKMFEEESHSNVVSATKVSSLSNLLDPGASSLFLDTNGGFERGQSSTTLNSSLMIDNAIPVHVADVMNFLYNSMMTLPDTPINSEGLMNINEVLLEFDEFEEMHLKKFQESPDKEYGSDKNESG